MDEPECPLLTSATKVRINGEYPYLIPDECVWPIDLPGIGTVRCGGPVEWGCPFPHQQPDCPRIEEGAKG